MNILSQRDEKEKNENLSYCLFVHEMVICIYHQESYQAYLFRIWYVKKFVFFWVKTLTSIG